MYIHPLRRQVDVDTFLRAVAWALPRRLVMWCVLRVWAHGTTGEYGDTITPELTIADALQRWERT